MTCSWFYFPNTRRPSGELLSIVDIFNGSEDQISSEVHSLKSDEVLAIIADKLRSKNFKVEGGKKNNELIKMPVLFKEGGVVEKEFYADAFQAERGIVLEVEAGRGVANHQFLKDFFEACMMQDAKYLCIAVRKVYSTPRNTSRDFERVCAFFKTLYASNRLGIPLEGVLIIGY